MSENPENLLTRINLAAQQYSMGAGGASVTRPDILAAVGMGHLSREAWLMVNAYYLQDSTVLSELSKALWLKAVDLAIKEGWDIPRGQELLRRMAVLALYELFQPTMCPRCKNDEKLRQTCLRCHRHGYVSLSIRRQAEICRLQKDTWRNKWRRRYQLVFREAKRWLLEAESHIGEHAGSFRDMPQTAAGLHTGSAPSTSWAFDAARNAQLRKQERQRLKKPSAPRRK